MPTGSFAARLGTLREVLSDALAELERIGEAVAAAHLAAALEVIEDRLDASGPERAARAAGGEIARFSDQMHTAFGEQAEAVARRQLSAASGSSLTAWAAIINRLAG